MGITLSEFQKLVAGSKRRNIVKASVATYTAGGETVTPQALGLSGVDGVSALYSAGIDVAYTGGKLVFYDSGGTECATSATFTAIIEVVGR